MKDKGQELSNFAPSWMLINSVFWKLLLNKHNFQFLNCFIYAVMATILLCIIKKQGIFLKNQNIES